MIVVWVALLILGLAAAATGSKRAVTSALVVSEGLGVSAGLVGVSVLAIGTDLPEIANSITAALAGHGDLNVGDSTGSALTQITLVLAILMIATGLGAGRHRNASDVVVPAGLMTVGALVVLAAMLADGELGQVDGLVLIIGWGLSLVVLQRRESKDRGPMTLPDRTVGPALLQVLGWLALVGLSATAVVQSFVQITEILGVPQFIASSIVLALGTSLPELFVDWTAVRRGAGALAIGDLFGSSLVDSTLAVGIGPAIRATAVSSQALTGTLVIAVGVAAATLIVATTRRSRAVAGGLIAVYAIATLALLVLAS